MFRSITLIIALLTLSASAFGAVGGGGMPVITFPTIPATPSPGGAIGSLSWDGSSSFIENSANSKRYLQLGLLKNYTYQQTLDALSPRGPWSDFHLATIDEAYEFANAISKVEFKNNPASTIDSFTAETKNAFEDGVLGFNYNGSFDSLLFFSNPTEEMVGILYLRPNLSQVYFSELYGTYDPYYFNRFARYGSQETRSWLVVSNYTISTPVPEPDSLSMMLVGISIFVVLSRRRKKLKPTQHLIINKIKSAQKQPVAIYSPRRAY